MEIVHLDSTSETPIMYLGFGRHYGILVDEVAWLGWSDGIQEPFFSNVTEALQLQKTVQSCMLPQSGGIHLILQKSGTIIFLKSADSMGTMILSSSKSKYYIQDPGLHS
jgi:hypothetical protein